jgi:hypothetical protein
MLSCCPDTIDFCMKFEFTDTTCVTCDTSFCFRKIRTTATGPTRKHDMKIEIEKMNRELEEDQIDNGEEYKKLREEQDELIKRNKKDGEGQGGFKTGSTARINRKVKGE